MKGHKEHHGVKHSAHHVAHHTAHHGVHELAHHGVHHARKARKAGGKVEDDIVGTGKGHEVATDGYNEAEKDLKDKPEQRNNAHKIFGEAEAMHEKKGGRVKRKHGGKLHHMKHVGHVEGEHAKHHAGRKPRKSGGRASSDTSPFTSARHGEAAKGRHLEPETMG